FNFVESDPSLLLLFGHDLFRKPLHTFRDHALVLLSQKVAVLRLLESVKGRDSRQREAAMDDRQSETSESRFVAYVEGLVSVIGHADRAQPLRDYCTGLIMPCERKSVEPLAVVTAPARVAAQHQSLLHFVGEGHWS